jgi:hypothetical protein
MISEQKPIIPSELGGQKRGESDGQSKVSVFGAGKEREIFSQRRGDAANEAAAMTDSKLVVGRISIEPGRNDG